jgi:hypothetical protein
MKLKNVKSILASIGLLIIENFDIAYKIKGKVFLVPVYTSKEKTFTKYMFQLVTGLFSRLCLIFVAEF